jgi:hypothetical protein
MAVTTRPEAQVTTMQTTVAGLQVSEMATARAVAARAEVESRYLMALQRPRDWALVRAKLMETCGDPDFASEAIYARPMGGGKDVTGLSIRFVEAALACLTNAFVNSTVVYEDEAARVIRVVATDLESNVTHSTELTVSKTVERARLDEGRTAIAERVNTRGRRTYIVQATDDELFLKQNNLTSKAIRNCGLRLIPAGLLAEAERMLRQGARKAAGKPDAVTRMVEAFAGLGVDQKQLEGYLERPLAGATQQQIADLRALYTALQDGELTWDELRAQNAAPPPADPHGVRQPERPYGEAAGEQDAAAPTQGVKREAARKARNDQ